MSRPSKDSVEHALTRLQRRELEVVTDAGERIDRRGGDPIEIGRRVAEALGERAPHLEMELSVRVLSDALVHVLDLGFNCVGIDGVHGFSSVVAVVARIVLQPPCHPSSPTFEAAFCGETPVF